ncbi:MAG: hypothetical protein ACR2I2_09995 [Bryobacteraceae bacterium]
MKIEKVPYGGWPNCYRIANGDVELIVTGDVGPRIMRYGFTGGRNLFKEYAETLGKSGEPDWQLRGGHRLWAAPEQHPRTYAPDNDPVQVTVHGDVLEAVQPVEPSTGLQKRIVVKLAAEGTGVDVLHRITNTLPWSIEVSPWALTMMAQGGVGLTGFPPRGEHPGILPPTHPLVMWAFTDLTDPRWIFTKKYLGLRQDPNNAVPQKLGLYNEHTWGAYLLGSDLFLKECWADPVGTYPDRGCSYETFSRNDMLEIETLGPLERVTPGDTVEHMERWSLHRNIRIPEFTDACLDNVIAPLLDKWMLE